jgi:phosphatidylserine/phosphatidylglycerophosphate/cardiolipin synthase-like enzyme
VKPFIFMAFVVTLVVVTLVIKGCNTLLTPAPTTIAAAPATHRLSESLGSIPSFTDWTAKPSPDVPLNDSVLRAASPISGVVAPDKQSTVATYRSPSTNLEKVDEAYLAHVTGHLDIAMYSFTDQNLATAVAKLANSGIPVRIYRDQQQYQQEQAEHARVNQILAASPNIHIKVKGSNELMHIKGWADTQMLRDGSANWSPSGEVQQDNTLVLTTDKSSVHSFETNFDAMWKRTSNIVIK